MADIRTGPAAQRSAKVVNAPGLGKVSPEVVSIQQLPKVKVPSIYDDAVQNSKLVSETLKVNVDGVLSKLEKIQGSVSSAVASATSQLQSGASALGSKLKSAAPALSSAPAFSSVSEMFPDQKTKDSVALGVPDLESVDKKAFGGKLGGQASDVKLESDEVDLLEAASKAAVATAAVATIASAKAQQPVKLGSSLSTPPVPVPEPVPVVRDDVPILRYDQPSPEIDLLDGGGF